MVETSCNDMHIGYPFVTIFFTYYSLVMGVWWSDWVDHMEIGIGQVILLGWLIFQTYFVLTSAGFVY
jgi:hypothetical protein